MHSVIRFILFLRATASALIRRIFSHRPFFEAASNFSPPYLIGRPGKRVMQSRRKKRRTAVSLRYRSLEEEGTYSWRVLDNESTILYRRWNLRFDLDNARDTLLWNDDTRISRESEDYRERFGLVSMRLSIRTTRSPPTYPSRPFYHRRFRRVSFESR